MISLLLILSWQVFSRYVLNNPSTVTEELSRLLLVVMGALGASFTFLEKKHLSLDLIANNASPKFRKFLTEFSGITVMLLGLIFIVGGSMMIFEKWSLGQTSAVLGYRLVYLYFLVPFCGIIILLSPFYTPEKKD